MTDHRRRSATILGTLLAASLAIGAFAGPAAAAPDPDKAQQRAEQKAERQTLRAERKTKLRAAQAERAELRELRKAALERRKLDARMLRQQARTAISDMRDGFSGMTLEERRATLDGIHEARAEFMTLLLTLMDTWHAERRTLLPNTLSSTPEEPADGES